MAIRNPRYALAAIALPVLFLAMSGLARATTFTVNNTNDTGMGSLRDAITSANAAPTVVNRINFSVSGTITLASTLPTIVNTSPGSLTIDGSGQTIIVDGAMLWQGFIVSSGATLTLQNLTLAHCWNIFGDFVGGGGIDNSGALTVTNCTFFDDFDFDAGGGIVNRAGGSLAVTNSTFSDNTADEGDGGGIFNDIGAKLTVINSTFSGNNVFDVGGGIANSGTLTVTNSTFSGNSADNGGGGIFNENIATLKSTILANEASGGNCAGIATPPVTDASYNISDDDSCGFSGTSVNNSTTLNLDPAGLANNGGPTQTIALEPNSEAIDFIPIASCTDQSSPTPLPLTTDQRGFPRPDSGNLAACDAGAFELQTGRLAVVSGSERTQISRSTSGTSDQVNMAFSFIDNGSPILDDPPSASIVGPHCDDGTDALNGIDVNLYEGTCASLATATGGLLLDLIPFVVHTVNHASYGTLFQSSPTVPSPETVSARIVQLLTPEGTCGEWTLNVEVAGLDTGAIGLGGGNPFALVVEDGDKNEGCFDVTNAIVGNQIPKPSHSVRRGVRRQTRR